MKYSEGRIMKFYFTKGKINYKKDGWIVLDCPYSVVNYYRWVIEKLIGKKLSTSYHGAHVSIVPAKHEGDLTQHPLWGKHHGKEVEFKYFSEIHTDHEWFYCGQYFWLVVECPIIHQIRTELGLKPNLKWKTHLTIGYCCRQ